MRNATFYGAVLLLCMLLFGCSNDDHLGTMRLHGTWQLIEVYDHPGYGNGQWVPVEDGYIYNFFPTNHFTSNRFSECENGLYSMSATQITLQYECDGFTTGIESSQGAFIENYTFESDTLILIPDYLSCSEGCGWKFKKVD